MPDRYLPLSEYARFCGVSRQAIAGRIKAGSLPVTLRKNPDGTRTKYVDIEANPPVKMGKNRKAI